jgi:class 3 adenylate cyclase
MSSYANVPNTLEEWAGSRHLSLTLLFTDIVKSTSIGVRLGDGKWIEDLFVHFNQARGLAIRYDSYVVKVIGDSLMIAFRTSTEAVDFALEFATFTGVDYIGIRVGINSGQVQIRENDIYGLNVNLTSRIQQSLPNEGIRVSTPVKEDYESVQGKSRFFFSEEIELASFGKKTLWRADSSELREAWLTQARARAQLLGLRPPPGRGQRASQTPRM